MFQVGDKIVYNENGICTVDAIAPLASDRSASPRLYYHLIPLIGSGDYFAPVDSPVYMRPAISRAEAEALIASIPSIEPAVCTDNRFNRVDAFYKELFRQHSNEALVAIIKGLTLRLAEKKNKSSRAEATLKRARDMLRSELSVALSLPMEEVGAFVAAQCGESIF